MATFLLTLPSKMQMDRGSTRQRSTPPLEFQQLMPARVIQLMTSRLVFNSPRPLAQVPFILGPVMSYRIIPRQPQATTPISRRQLTLLSFSAQPDRALITKTHSTIFLSLSSIVRCLFPLMFSVGSASKRKRSHQAKTSHLLHQSLPTRTNASSALAPFPDEQNSTSTSRPTTSPINVRHQGHVLTATRNNATWTGIMLPPIQRTPTNWASDGARAYARRATRHSLV
ncbi:hypothetical protein B0T10DRAFT_28036 [Thelonectria olida]|uniref:Uncharacterized protein n=1 Tax=Thelonectria olida TaxID=1576542 RepID=A0A9P8WKZ7_9HYPO|nr:hypothetical protein B0T10DRAFT_28036 [Thelonectria olida]